jgi:hypothetical protein
MCPIHKKNNAEVESIFDTLPTLIDVNDGIDYESFQAQFSIDYNVSNILIMNSFYESI